MNQKHSKEYKSIGQTIKKYRKLRGLTQEQLADMVCISISYLTKIEAPNCDQPFSLEVILDISEVLDISGYRTKRVDGLIPFNKRSVIIM